MPFLLCRNRVEDFARWKRVFDAHKSAHRASGLDLRDLWRDLNAPNNVFFLFAVTDLAKAQAFINAPQAGDAARQSGVLEGEYHFLESGVGY